MQKITLGGSRIFCKGVDLPPPPPPWGMPTYHQQGVLPPLPQIGPGEDIPYPGRGLALRVYSHRARELLLKEYIDFKCTIHTKQYR